MKKIIRHNPGSMYTPVGNYTHVTKIPAQCDTYVFSGQIGAMADGSIPADYKDEVRQLFENISQLMMETHIQAEAITKVNIWAVKPIDWDYFDSLWNEFFKGNNPSMTIAYVVALGLPEINIEIDIWAAQ